MTFEQEYLDVLQNLEFEIVQFYKEQPDLIDAEVLTAIESLIRFYSGEAQGRTVTLRPLRGTSAEVANRVQAVCEWRLGRGSISDENSQSLDSEVAPKTASEIAECLKRIQSSIKLWTKKGGRQGYLDYVMQFIK
ncbi:MAG TPA: hypothetical protein VK203_06985 [Nostocaceae cyanobacterium]|nr:hypothetical protein [Nostocaceae cyanobacterium]